METNLHPLPTLAVLFLILFSVTESFPRHLPPSAGTFPTPLTSAVASPDVTNIPVTIFAPSDFSLLTCSSCSIPLLLLHQHTVSGSYSLQNLRHLPSGTELETVAAGYCLTITTTEDEVFVNGVQISRPDLFDNGAVLVHGLQLQGFVSPHSCNSMTSLPFRPTSAMTLHHGIILADCTSPTISATTAFVVNPKRILQPITTYDFIGLVMQWPATFCSFMMPGKCKFVPHWMIIHGSWPDRLSLNLKPYMCRHLPHGNTQYSGVTQAVAASYQTAWPDIIGGPQSQIFWKYEWDSHGVCSNLPQTAYFQNTIQLAVTYNITLELAKAGILPGSRPSLIKLNNTVAISFGYRPDIRCWIDIAANCFLKEIILCYYSFLDSARMDCPDNAFRTPSRTCMACTAGIELT